MTKLMPTLLTADEYLATADQRPERTELIDGEIVVTEPTLRHQRIALFLLAEIEIWRRAGPGRGEVGMPVDVRLDDANVFAPDVWWVGDDRRPGRDDRWMDGPPELAVEVRSPSTWRYDVGRKFRTYERTGLRELWLVDTESNTVLVFRRSAPDVDELDDTAELGAGDALTSPLLPGFTLPIQVVFDR